MQYGVSRVRYSALERQGWGRRQRHATTMAGRLPARRRERRQCARHHDNGGKLPAHRGLFRQGFFTRSASSALEVGVASWCGICGGGAGGGWGERAWLGLNSGGGGALPPPRRPHQCRPPAFPPCQGPHLVELWEGGGYAGAQEAEGGPGLHGVGARRCRGAQGLRGGQNWAWAGCWGRWGLTGRPRARSCCGLAEESGQRLSRVGPRALPPPRSHAPHLAG